MANKGNKKSLFWTSYSDLMTSLFFAMLVLFVVAVVAMGSANRQLKQALGKANITIEQQNQLLNLNQQFKTLTESSSLNYDEEKRMFYAKDFVGKEIFLPDSAIIRNEYITLVDKVGADIKKLLQNLSKENKNFKYQLVIEGTAARTTKFNVDDPRMYILSYRRALALYNRWLKYDLRKYNTEIIIAGSGFNGNNRDNKVEWNNKRFMIQIIPKIDPPEVKKLKESK